ncbi:DUF6624 domain-containing protein [Xanthomonas phaseoli]|uniref:DUF6624 domain-containing protein n=1 Tax=Xanthomonas phaseoli TaxID=1985254 RepID=UPI00037E235A|nr:DUF6624 domain-containing protein [Xanthomonas phaseoli]
MKMVLLGMLLWGQWAMPVQAFAEDAEEQPARQQSMNASYRQQLLALADVDQKIRAEIRGAVTAQQLQANQGAAKEMAMRLVASQRENQAALSRLIDQFGFPDIPSVGEDGAHAGFLIAQHSTDRAFRDDFLQKMQAAAQRGAYSTADLALFIDRNLIMSGKPQRYGTQRRADGSLFELEDPAELKKRRAEAGLPEEEDSVRGR